MAAMGNGFSDFIATYGVIGFMTWFACVFLGLRLLCRGNIIRALYISSIIVLALLGEPLLNYPLFFGLAFLRPNASLQRVVSQPIAASRSRKQLHFPFKSVTNEVE